MVRRGKTICAVLVLLVIFLLLSLRNSGTHSRDMHADRFKDTRKESYPIIKEPPGKWDPIEDKFRDQLATDGINVKGLQEQLNDIQRQVFDLPDEPIQRKPIRKGGSDTRKLEDKAKGQPLNDNESNHLGVDGSDAAVVEKGEVNVKPYDPAAGFGLSQCVLIYRSRPYSQSRTNNRMSFIISMN